MYSTMFVHITYTMIWCVGESVPFTTSGSIILKR
jgi:hypothetical protein